MCPATDFIIFGTFHTSDSQSVLLSFSYNHMELLPKKGAPEIPGTSPFGPQCADFTNCPHEPIAAFYPECSILTFKLILCQYRIPDQWLSTGVAIAPKGRLQCLETFLVITPRGTLLTSNGQRLRILLNLLQYADPW